MKEFLINLAIASVVAATFLFVMFRNVETEWKPIEKTGGSGTQAVGESDLVLPGGGVEVAMAQEQTVYDMEVSGMTDAEKLALIDKMLESAFDNFWDVDDAQAWKCVAVAINDVVEFGGDADG